MSIRDGIGGRDRSRRDGSVYPIRQLVPPSAGMAERAREGAALAQLQRKGYAERYRRFGQPIHLVGVEFSAESRSLTAFETAPG